MDLTVQIKNVFLFGQMPPLGEGFVISPDGFEGWDDSVSVKGDAVSRPQSHGDFDVPGFLDSRVVSISGSCIAGSAQRLNALGSQLRGLLAEGGGQVVVHHMGEHLWGTARLAPGTQTKFKVNGSDSRSAKFQIQLKFADPRKYGGSKTFAGGASAYHYGNFPAIPTHVISGARVGGYTVSGPGGKQFVVTATLATGSPHTIDRAGGLFINGSQVFGAVTRADTWTIPAGAQVTQTVSNSLTLATTVTDTFL